jgi:hypothetical protein
MAILALCMKELTREFSAGRCRTNSNRQSIPSSLALPQSGLITTERKTMRQYQARFLTQATTVRSIMAPIAA